MNDKITLKPLMFIFLIIALFLVASFSVSAEIDIVKYTPSYNFITGAQIAEPNVCACGSLIDTIFIDNVGTYGQVFTIETNVPELASIPVKTIQLEPGQKTELVILLTPKCGLEKDFEYEVYIKSNIATNQVIKRNLKVNKCNSLKSLLYPQTNITTPCTPINYTIIIENPSPFPEQYTIQPTKFKEYFDYEAWGIVLEPGQSGRVDTVFHPECSIYGDYKLGFEINSVNNDLKSYHYHDLTIEQKYDFTAEIPNQVNVCKDEETQTNIKLTNDMTFPINYSLSLIGAPKFISLDERNIYLEGLQSSNFNINFNPSEKNIGDYTFYLEIKTDIGDTIVTKEINLSVINCYDIDVNINAPENPQFCSGEYTLNATIKNNGQFTENVYLSLEPTDLTVLDEEAIELNPGQEKEISFNVDLNNDLGNANVGVVLVAGLNERTTTDFWTDSVTLSTKNQYTCTKPELANYWIYTKYNSNETYLKIKNTGIHTADYTLELMNTTKLFLEKDEVRVEPGNTQTITVFKFYNDTESNRKEFDILITAQENNEEYYYTFKIIQTGSPLIDEVTDYIFSSACKTTSFVLVIILIVAIILLIIRISMKRTTYKNQGNAGMLLFLLALLVFIGTLVIFGAPNTWNAQLNNTDPLYVQWYENNDYILNLNNYFTDPDMDSLTYTLDREAENITITIENNLATLTPDENYKGVDRAKFRATDLDDESATSDWISFEIHESREWNNSDAHQEYCIYINAGILILILLVLIAIPWKKKPLKQTKEGKIKKTNLKREPGYTYYVDKDGDVARRKTKRKK